MTMTVLRDSEPCSLVEGAASIIMATALMMEPVCTSESSINSYDTAQYPGRLVLSETT
jgi:hypothetical protein